MQRSLKAPDAFRKAIIKSLLAHILLVLIFLVGIPDYIFQRPEPLDIIEVELPRGTGEDYKDVKEVQHLPDSTIQEQQNPMPEAKDTRTTAPQKTEVQHTPPAENPNQMREPEKKPPKVVTKPTPQKPNSAMSAALATIDRQIKQRRVDPGVAQTGTGSEGNKYGNADKYKAGPGDPEYIRYVAMVKAKIQREWVRVGTVPNLKLGIRVRISNSGQVISKSLSRSSGDSSLDGSLLRAIDRASPFPVPPQSVKDEAVGEGFMIGFINK